MNALEFFNKYSKWYADNTRDSRGVLGEMSDAAVVPYLEFRDDIRSCKDIPILVEHYHPERPYFWGTPEKFPYTEESGPGPGNKPIVFKRALDWFMVPKKAKLLSPLCFTVLKWNFEVTVIVFRNMIHVDFETKYSKEEINLFLEAYCQ